MKIKALLDEDFVNFKECSMFIGFPSCTWKCGEGLCQNSCLAAAESIEVSIEELIERYKKNPISRAVVCGGLEPFDSFDNLFKFARQLRIAGENGFIVIYTGYNKSEIMKLVEPLQLLHNIIIKFGRYIPDQKPHYDKVLGVMLQSDNQYGEVIS